MNAALASVLCLGLNAGLLVYLARLDRGGGLVVLTATPAYKCPAAPYEAAMLLEHDCRKRGVREAVQIDLYAAEPGPMGVAGPQSPPVSAAWSKRKASATTRSIK